MQNIIFNKPTTNIQRAFGLFALLQSKGFTRGNLNPAEPYIVINTADKTFYSSPAETGAQDIPADYKNLIK